MAALNIQKGASSHSAYDLRDPNAQVIESHTLAVLVENEPGVLARVIGLFAGRGYNIDSLTVAEVDHLGHRSRITIVTRGTPAVIEQISGSIASLKSPTYSHSRMPVNTSVTKKKPTTAKISSMMSPTTFSMCSSSSSGRSVSAATTSASSAPRRSGGRKPTAST